MVMVVLMVLMMLVVVVDDGGGDGGGSLVSVCGQSLSTPAKHSYFTYLLYNKTYLTNI